VLVVHKMRLSLLRGLIIAAVIILLFWMGGFALLKYGSDWPEIEATIRRDPRIVEMGGVEIYSISPKFWGYRYGFSGPEGHAKFMAEIVAKTRRLSVEVSLTRSDGRWSLMDVVLRE